MKNIFISYRRSDSSDVTGRIYDHLKAKFGQDAIFKDVESIALGEDFRTVVGDAVSGCQVLLVVIGNDWLSVEDDEGLRRLDNEDDYVRVEIMTAFEKNIPVIPILVENASMPKPQELPEPLRAITFRNAAPVRADPDFHTDIQRVIEELGKYNQVGSEPKVSLLSRRTAILAAGTVFLIAGVLGNFQGWFSSSAINPSETATNSVQSAASPDQPTVAPRQPLPAILPYQLRVEVPFVKPDGTLATTGNNSHVANAILLEIVQQDASLPTETVVATWFDNEVKKRFPRAASGQAISFTPSAEKACPDDLVAIFWAYFKSPLNGTNAKTIVSRREMKSQPTENEKTYAFVGYPFFEPEGVTYPKEDTVVLKRGGTVPIVLVCKDGVLRSKIETELRSLGYDVHLEERLESLKESTGMLNERGKENPEEKFEQIKQSYVYAILRIELN